MAGPRGIKIGIGAVVAVLVAGAGASNVYAPGGNPIKTHPAPTLFTQAQVNPLAAELAKQKPLADEAFATWAASHPTQDDAAFTAFALSQIPAPPDATTQVRELAELHQLGGTRTPDGLTAASWLEIYGKKDVWKLYVSDATETATPEVRTQAKTVFKADTALAKAMTATAQARFGGRPRLSSTLRCARALRARPNSPTRASTRSTSTPSSRCSLLLTRVVRQTSRRWPTRSPSRACTPPGTTAAISLPERS